MNFSELQARRTNSENLRTEFKECTVHQDDLAASLIALAHTDSGQLILEAANKGNIIGIDNPDRTIVCYPLQCFRKKISPHISASDKGDTALGTDGEGFHWDEGA